MTLHKVKDCVAKVLIVAMLFLSGCVLPGTEDASENNLPEDSIEHIPAHLTLTEQEMHPGRDDIHAAHLLLSAYPGSEKPRVLELFIEFTAGLSFDGFEKGSAVLASNKNLIVQEKANNQLRVLIFSGENTSPIGLGTLGHFYFKRLVSDIAELTIVKQRPVFAPGSANDGLILGDKLVFE